MRKIFLFVALATACLSLVAAPAAFATPGRSDCSGCHTLDSRVTVSATFQGCSGTNALYNVSVSDVYANGEGWAVFSGTTNIANGYYTGPNAPSMFSVAGGRSYTVRGVSDGTNRGGSAAITINPVCDSCTPSPENCTDGVDNDCDGVVDCRDSNCSANPACVVCVPAAEVCTDGLDNDCDGRIDCGDNDCSSAANCNGGCSPTSRSERRRCADGIDNDCDGRTDCQDRDCRSSKLCP